jgi:hypothetical protein
VRINNSPGCRLGAVSIFSTFVAVHSLSVM